MQRPYCLKVSKRYVGYPYVYNRSFDLMCDRVKHQKVNSLHFFFSLTATVCTYKVQRKFFQYMLTEWSTSLEKAGAELIYISRTCENLGKIRLIESFKSATSENGKKKIR